MRKRRHFAPETGKLGKFDGLVDPFPLEMENIAAAIPLLKGSERDVPPSKASWTRFPPPTRCQPVQKFHWINL